MISPMNKKNINPESGLRVRALREKLGLTRKQFEELGGFKAGTLRHLEKGNQAMQATTARMLSNLFIYRFELDPEEASEHVILYGKQGGNLAKE
jgi:transcriptional regulator with XRE-family HTH domain